MNNIEKKLSELVQLLNEQEEVQKFKKIEEKMQANEFVKTRIDAYKKMQQKVVLYESKNEELPKEVSDKLDKLYQELFDIPIYNEYIQLQSEVNEVLQHITFVIENELNK